MWLKIYGWKNPSTDETPYVKHLCNINISFHDVANRIQHACFLAGGSGTSTLFIHFQVCCRAPLGWLWQGPPNVRRWPMLRSQAARPECVWPGWKVPFRPSAASLPLLPSATESHSEGREKEEVEEGQNKKKLQCGTKVWTVLCKSPAWMYTCVTHIQY